MRGGVKGGRETDSQKLGVEGKKATEIWDRKKKDSKDYLKRSKKGESPHCCYCVWTFIVTGFRLMSPAPLGTCASMHWGSCTEWRSQGSLKRKTKVERKQENPKARKNSYTFHQALKVNQLGKQERPRKELPSALACQTLCGGWAANSTAHLLLCDSAEHSTVPRGQIHLPEGQRWHPLGLF